MPVVNFSQGLNVLIQKMLPFSPTNNDPKTLHVILFIGYAIFCPQKTVCRLTVSSLNNYFCCHTL